MIAFFGTGLLGGNFVRALRKRGEDVHVWNRSPDKAKALEEAGARAFADPADAAKGAARIHLTLSDDAAVDDVLERARPGFAPSVDVVDHTTTSPTGTRARAARWAERGVSFLHAPVFMGPPNALDATGVMLVSGDAARIARLRPALAAMTGKLVELGPEPDRAAAFKLLGNAFLMFLTAGLADMFALGKALGVPPADVAGLFDFFNPGAMVPARAKRMREAVPGPASWELGMARKDARLMLEEAARAGATLSTLPAIAALMDRFIERGHAHDDWTVIGSDGLG
ncbi:MAG TPA: NAD(P)-dependent oxidoreductase [Minicystis sp.]|nr:NAD(P)-dependent oxidoreductase [Minicystis sp.]